MKFIFASGFALDDSFWEPLKPFFQNHLCEFLNQESNFKFDPTESLIGIGHSYGLHRLLRLPLKWHRLIGIKSFIDFLGNENSLYQKRSIEFTAFKNQFLMKPKSTLNKFYKKCNFKPNCMPLYEDALNDLDALAKPIPLPKTPTLIIGGERDPVVPMELIEDNFMHKNNVRIKFTPCGHHGISEFPQLIADSIYNFLDEAF